MSGSDAIWTLLFLLAIIIGAWGILNLLARAVIFLGSG